MWVLFPSQLEWSILCPIGMSYAQGCFLNMSNVVAASSLSGPWGMHVYRLNFTGCLILPNETWENLDTAKIVGDWNLLHYKADATPHTYVAEQWEVIRYHLISIVSYPVGIIVESPTSLKNWQTIKERDPGQAVQLLYPYYLHVYL